MKRNNRLFINGMRNFSKSTNSSGNRFSWRGKALSKSLKNHLRVEKVMGIAGKLYCSNPNRFPKCRCFAAFNVLCSGFKSSFPLVSGFTGSGHCALSWSQSCCHSSRRFFIRKHKRSEIQFFKKPCNRVMSVKSSYLRAGGKLLGI